MLKLRRLKKREREGMRKGRKKQDVLIYNKERDELFLESPAKIMSRPKEKSSPAQG